jgi:anti-anti-sigma regulatory factor
VARLAPRLTITCSSAGACWELVLRGSLDAGSVIALRSQLDQLESGEFDHVIVDVSELTVIDHFGAAALGVLGEQVTVAGAELQLRYRGSTLAPSVPPLAVGHG